MWVSLGQDLRRHNIEDFYTPYMLTAGFASGLFTLLLAVTLGRRKRASWILNLVLSGLLALLLAYALFAYEEIREHPQNWVSLALTAAFTGALLLVSASSTPRATAPTRRSPPPSPPSACWSPRWSRPCSSAPPTPLRSAPSPPSWRAGSTA